jgi:hypothetical protein
MREPRLVKHRGRYAVIENVRWRRRSLGTDNEAHALIVPILLEIIPEMQIVCPVDVPRSLPQGS